MSELTPERLEELRRICTASLENPCNENLAIFDSAFTDERCLMLVDEIERLRRERETLAEGVSGAMRILVQSELIGLDEDGDPVCDEQYYDDVLRVVTAFALLDGEKGGGGA